MPKITLIAHNIRSTYNVGAIFRTAEGFGVDKIILSGYTPYPSHAEDRRLPHESAKITAQIHKSALGAEELVPFEHISDFSAWASQYPAPIIALEQTSNSIDIRDYVAPAEFGLLLGEEVHGIEPWILELCDECIEIPMSGKKESFNVSVATGIALYGLTT